MGLLDKLFGGNKADQIKDFIARDAIIVDVRTSGEYSGGAIPGSKNIPLQSLSGKISTIKKWNKPVITCCASGMRSANAASVLKSNGIEVMNGGGYMSLYNKLQ
ncbi:rhodanese [Neptunitalea chrysea]|uniref:Rhodanese n=1 Tax=Neptunitalea chrysea TaxID=1647581 RepID=A0A9W6ETZ3_9FLAO|nr:rhodanese-like domain-containing protein [Neptunitalea chrysea]GLB52805.1 rhodanese [Neptunitalea chrysea]